MNYFIAPGLKRIHPQLALMDSITKYIASSNATTPEAIKSKSRVRKIKEARFECMYILKKCTSMTYAYIGDYYNRDHASVIHAVNTIAFEMEYDREIKAYIKEVMKYFGIAKRKLKK